MEAGVFVEFGVEGYAELIVLVGSDDAGRADKRQRRFAVDAGYLPLGSKAAELPAVGIALDKYIHGCQTRRAFIVMGGKVVSQ